MNASEISPAALELLRELAEAPEVVGYDFRIKELDEAKPRLIEWKLYEGWIASDAGRALLAQHQPSS